jgi:hypothetical protein
MDLDIPTQPRVAGEAGGKLIHKLARATHGTLVPWSNPSSRPVGRGETVPSYAIMRG